MVKALEAWPRPSGRGKSRGGVVKTVRPFPRLWERGQGRGGVAKAVGVWPVTKKLDLGKNWPGGPIIAAKGGPPGSTWNAINGPCVPKVDPPVAYKTNVRKGHLQ